MLHCYQSRWRPCIHPHQQMPLPCLKISPLSFCEYQEKATEEQRVQSMQRAFNVSREDPHKLISKTNGFLCL
ncbi:hypothetical protein SLEP1_g35959 [Rubroshorea leprosula]|uniref:Uncharacterized protein n=1 Tax=Rubroshorea leprosula TaxID=152421 RepID=A0AAV5KQ22_9ROSI|nr:hypothetical protein SLEP1_g35959 [Rubroshorea leprosula]